MNDKGYIRLNRELINWEWYDDCYLLKLWIHILLSVNWEDKKWHGIDVPKGSFITSREQLSKKCKLSEQKIRTCLHKLENTQEITIKSTNKYTHIFVNKWEEYQYCNNLSTNNLTNNQPTINQQSTTTKEYKELKELKEEYISNPYSLDRDENGNLKNY